MTEHRYSDGPEKALLVYLANREESEEQIDSALTELEQLVNTTGPGQWPGRATQGEPDPAHCIGAGKVDEVAQVLEGDNIGLVVFECEISPCR